MGLGCEGGSIVTVTITDSVIRFIFEGDSLVLIKKKNSEAHDFSEISALVWEAKGLTRNMHACRFLFIPRGGNQAAHFLAGESFLDSTDRFWVEEVPPTVLPFVEADRRYATPSLSAGLVCSSLLLGSIC
ncbi:hypothetical protein V6N11_049975 [Hibiscus sabdariffa]|uniref:RNase H type-1 domain-containing protein n=1 Tax=Hibiscus sabdariffa TaxID=183260 RepID=A0ABR2T8G7_9ROSI